MDFDTWQDNTRDLIMDENNPLAFKNGTWKIEQRIAVWVELGPRIFDEHLDLLQKNIVNTLSELDPKFELPPDERISASIMGKDLKHSHQIRKGLSETLALLGNYPDALTNCTRGKPEFIVSSTIEQIFKEGDWRLWASLDDLLPTLAEASPDTFLNILEKNLEKNSIAFTNLFNEEDNGIFGRCYMTGILWSLEALAWNEKNFIRISCILAELSMIDPGGNWTNRPLNSLISILLPWHPQTLASDEKKKSAINLLKKSFPTITWRLLISLLPSQTQSSTGTYKPVWRDILPEDWAPTVKRNTYNNFIEYYSETAFQMAKVNLEYLKELLEKLDNTPPIIMDKILQHLDSDIVTSMSADDKFPIWSALKNLVSKHQRFSDAEWALDKNIVKRIETAAASLAPQDPENKYLRLFNEDDFDLIDNLDNWKGGEEKLYKIRKVAIKEIIDYGGFESILSMIEKVIHPNTLGNSVASISDKNIDMKILPNFLKAEESNMKSFARGYVWRRQWEHGSKWIDKTVSLDWAQSEIVEFLCILPFKIITWEKVPKLLPGAEKKYWQLVPVSPYQADSDRLHAIEKLLDVKRPLAAIDCLECELRQNKKLHIKETIEALTASLNTTENVNTHNSYQITGLIKALQTDQNTDQKLLVQIEWAYLTLLTGTHKAQPIALERQLSSIPEFFCEIISLLYRSKNDSDNKKKPRSENKGLATNAYKLLDAWKTPPGTDEENLFSEKNFSSWLKKVKTITKKTGHYTVAMLEVGEVLFYSPADKEGLWINKSIAKVLNAKDAEKIRSGYRTEAMNSRGAHWVDPSGQQEVELAELWHKKADEVDTAGFPIFANLLESIANTYRKDAKSVIERHQS